MYVKHVVLSVLNEECDDVPRGDEAHSCNCVDCAQDATTAGSEQEEGTGMKTSRGRLHKPPSKKNINNNDNINNDNNDNNNDTNNNNNAPNVNIGNESTCLDQSAADMACTVDCLTL